jgi:hypothetical protein
MLVSLRAALRGDPLFHPSAWQPERISFADLWVRFNGPKIMKGEQNE